MRAIEPAHAETFSTSRRHRGHGESAGSPAGRGWSRKATLFVPLKRQPRDRAEDGTNSRAIASRLPTEDGSIAGMGGRSKEIEPRLPSVPIHSIHRRSPAAHHLKHHVDALQQPGVGFIGRAIVGPPFRIAVVPTARDR